MIEFITASHNNETLNKNLLSSDWVKEYELHILTGYTNVAEAYNAVKVNCPICLYVHNDVYLPKSFETDLITGINEVSLMDENFGVLGVAGVKLNRGKELHGYILDRGRVWGRPITKPVEVDTLDELLLITKGDFVFDENLPLDFYGADICMQAKEQGRKNYVINGFCHHNSSRPIGGRTESFYKSQEYFKNKWKKYLPIATTCSMLT